MRLTANLTAGGGAVTYWYNEVIRRHAPTADAAFPLELGLIRELQIYLKGFWNRRIRAKTAKDSQKVAGEKYESPPLTTPAFTIVGAYAKATDY